MVGRLLSVASFKFFISSSPFQFSNDLFISFMFSEIIYSSLQCLLIICLLKWVFLHFKKPSYTCSKAPSAALSPAGLLVRVYLLAAVLGSVAVLALSSCGAGASHCGGLSRGGAWVLGRAGSIVVAHGLSWPTAGGIFPDQGPNPGLPHWQVNS